MLLSESSPDSIDILSEEGISLHRKDMRLHLLRDNLVLEFLVAADLAVDAQHFLDVGYFVVAVDELRTGGHDVDLDRGSRTRS